ncbi:MAG TPA: dienelactone hydrolase family protein [Bryobacteraceae bacterium]|nr:dienelactone hydrolase family protein [Bryobacteraceae bacterium]
MSTQLDINRRQFLVTELAVGFAAAVAPIAAATITTDTEGLDAAEVKIPVRDGEMPGYRARPAGGKGLAVVLVVQEIFGVHEHIRDLCRRLAKRGYLAVAPELYARQGNVAAMTDIQEIISKVVSKVPDAQVLADLDDTAHWAASSQGGNAAKLGITGFCWGGRISWLYSGHNPDVKAAAAWYGRLVGPTDELHPRNPIDIAPSLKTPVLGLYGGEDQGITQESIGQMRAALKAAGNPSEIIVYPDAGHAFNADYRPSYRQGPAEDGWKKMLEWFKRYGVA